MSSESKIITIKAAARLLGVTPLTLRNWDNNGKLKALRHPINNYRVYRREDIDGIIEDMNTYKPAIKASLKKVPKKLTIKHLDDRDDIRDVA